jgi:GTP cyclohydrolase I
LNAPEKISLPDTQALPDWRRTPIQKVGIKGLRYPVALRMATGDVQHTVAEFAMTVGLAHDVKGTHMSRFVEVLETTSAPLDVRGLHGLQAQMLERLGADTGRIEMSFPYFIRKSAPVSGVESLLDYQARLTAETTADGRTRITLALTAPVTSLCPCSKKISERGAHNQRSHVTVTARTRGFVWIEEIIDIVERQASCELYGLLKRPDEKFVTERAYDNPKFVEDMVRDIAAILNKDARIEAYVVESENFESIHNHSAYALIRKDKTKVAA